jgi:hypothetical protein
MTARSAVALLLAGSSCATPPRTVPPPAPAALTGLSVEKVREELQVTPLELVFSGVRGETQGEEYVSLRNTGAAPLQVVRLELVGRDATLFKLSFGSRLPLTLVPGAQVAVTIGFVPPADAQPGVGRALLRVLVGPRADAGPPVDLAGLVTAGRTGDREPPLGQVLDALGFRIDTGADGLRLDTTAAFLGNEVRATRFRKARPSAVSLYPVARYASDDRVPYGIHTTAASAVQTDLLGAVAAANGQTLNPDLEPEGRTTFDPADRPFGVFETAGHRNQYLDDALNGGRHLARVYPLAGRAGGHIPNAYAIGFDEDGDGDYQDCVFVIWNVVPAP